ncbi:sugar-binding domain-containing protein [Pedobacter sp. JY14-1]|uniref:sugar-binding domain-containing protein n=1 Tax=Pedobacter sp. JY14-1 TaxID=3034151 RepID=UPI0023E2A145|nr:sugar-binding domain-containing protein [Pedobacter sp. JY14-1]
MKALKTALLALALPFIFRNTSEAQQTWRTQPNLIQTRWAKQVSPNNALKEYPRPQLERKSWQNLNGLWEYAITKKDVDIPSNYDGKILVPFPIESSLSGVKRELLPNQNLWYRRTIERSLSSLEMTNKRILLHFGAVDWQATVYLNGKEIGSHTGGYTAFSFDITEKLKAGKNELTVKVYDPTDKGIGPHGKQVLNPGNIYYTPSSGIWQTVWLETVPEEYIEGLKITPDVDKGEVSVEVNGPANVAVEVKAFDGKQEIASSRTPRNDDKITLKIPNAKLWSPDDPFLYDLEVTLGKDKVKSYFGMRKISVGKDEKGIDRIMLNNKPYFNLGTLDQGFWPDGLYTAPTDEALAFDIKAIKAMGFNTIRKHIKVEPARWYYHADKLGMVVWQDMVNPNQSLPEGSKPAFEQQNKETIVQLYNYPSITTWVLFNEKWGQYDQARLTKELKTMDPSRLVNGHSGEYLYVNNQLRSPSPDAYVNADMTDVHSYPNPMISEKQAGKARVLGEFGGIGVPIENHLWDDTKAGWGYDGIVTPQKMKAQYSAMVDSLVKLKEQGLSGSIYTQPFDVETEQNGIMTYDREIIKLKPEDLRTIHAKLQPVTANYLSATKGFTAKVADTVGKTYQERLAEYKAGKNDQQFLRNLALMAVAQKDIEHAKAIAGRYITGLKDPFIEPNLNFILMFTATEADPGHKLIMENLDRLSKVNGPKGALRYAQNIIFKTEVSHLLTENPDWSAVDAIIKKYPALDGELIVGLSVIRYRNAVAQKQQNATRNLVEAATCYDDRYNGGTYNDWSWQLFESTNDKKELEKALEWSGKSLVEEPKSAMYMDTYANLLYKLGRTQEAIEWEKKAVAQDPNEQVFKDTLEKMQKGLATWPETK